MEYLVYLRYRTMREKIFIRAFIDGNFGDDLFVKILCKRYPNKKFFIIGSGKYKSNFLKIENLEFIVCDRVIKKIICKIVNVFGDLTDITGAKYFNLLRFYTVKYSKIAELNILISGSYYIEWTDCSEYWRYYFKLEELYYSKRPCIIGINFGPYRTELYKRFYLQQLKKAVFISVRESKTFSLLEECNAVYAADVAFLYNINEKVLPAITNYILISVVNSSYCNSDYLDKMCAIISFALVKGLKIVLLALSQGEKDIETIQSILKMCGSKKNEIIVVEYGKVSTEEIVGWMNNANIVIAGRYHAMIVSWLLGTKVLPICYSEKMTNVINDINPQAVYYTLKNISELDEKGLFEIRYAMPCPDDVILKAERNFMWLDKIFEI